MLVMQEHNAPQNQQGSNSPYLKQVDYHIMWCCLFRNSSCYTTKQVAVVRATTSS